MTLQILARSVARRATAAVPKTRVAAKSTEAGAEALEPYSRTIQATHWVMGAGILTCFGTVQAKNYITDKKMKGTLMLVHKSTALLVLAALPVRLALRATAMYPKPPPGSTLEVLAGQAAHAGLYFGMVAMPATGVAMGYYGGKGLPFFGLFTIPGAAEKNGDIAKAAFGYHKQIGQAFEYLFLLHVGAVGYHAVKGQNILARMISGVAK